MLDQVVIALTILVGLGLLFAVILAIAYKKLRVYEDPRIDKVEEMLPNANCGACGEPGCRAFAEKVVGQINNPAKCTVSSPGGIEAIADYLGIEVSEEEKRVARLLCAGGRNEAQNLADYKGGISTCRGEAVVAGGPKDCTWGCLGLGDCASACTFGAITMSEDALPVVDPVKCTSCRDCVNECPKQLFVIMPVSRKLIVQCRSLLEGDDAESRCSVACTGCSRCAADAAPDLIEMVNNLPVIDYRFNNLSSPAATRRCPTGAIVWLEGEQQFAVSETVSEFPIGRVDVKPDLETEYYQ